MNPPLDFKRERERETGSWQRACEEPHLIERVAWDRWLVFFRDSEDAHLVRLHRDHGAYLGGCEIDKTGEECPGFAYHDGACAHLCAVRRADFGNLLDVRGQPVRIFDMEAVAQSTADHAAEPEERAATDGGIRRV
ncbi:MAG: hypothetical protein ABEI77_07530 [Halorientalis sp.]